MPINYPWFDQESCLPAQNHSIYFVSLSCFWAHSLQEDLGIYLIWEMTQPGFSLTYTNIFWTGMLGLYNKDHVEVILWQSDGKQRIVDYCLIGNAIFEDHCKHFQREGKSRSCCPSVPSYQPWPLSHMPMTSLPHLLLQYIASHLLNACHFQSQHWIHFCWYDLLSCGYSIPSLHALAKKKKKKTKKKQQQKGQDRCGLLSSKEMMIVNIGNLLEWWQHSQDFSMEVCHHPQRQNSTCLDFEQWPTSACGWLHLLLLRLAGTCKRIPEYLLPHQHSRSRKQVFDNSCTITKHKFVT